MNCLNSDYISKLQTTEIFVFGSNLKGYHGLGAAKAALEFGAKMGVGVGRQGQTYAIPTKNYNIRDRLSLDVIHQYILTFIEYVKENPQLDFLITEIGCGFSKYTPEDIAPLFETAVGLNNIYFSKSFYNILKSN